MDRWTELALVSHEVGGALTPARNAIHLLQENPPPGMDSRQQRLLQMIVRSLDRTDRVLGNLRSIALPDAHESHIETCHPHTWLPQWLEPFRDQAQHQNLQLHVDVDAALAAFPTDLFVLEQVLGNLVSNALKFTPSGGSVRVIAGEARGAVLPGRMLLLAGGFGFRPRFVQVTVSDSGIGLSAETRRHLFQPFYRGAEAKAHAGTGLGLTVARRLVRLLHGDLRADEAASGARFVLTLPADTATHELASGIDAFYVGLRRRLAQGQHNLLVARLPTAAHGDVAQTLLQDLARDQQATMWRIAPTTWVVLASTPIRALYRDLAARVSQQGAALQRELCVSVRPVQHGVAVDELALQSVVRCRQPIAAGVLLGAAGDSRTEVG